MKIIYTILCFILYGIFIWTEYINLTPYLSSVCVLLLKIVSLIWIILLQLIICKYIMKECRKRDGDQIYSNYCEKHVCEYYCYIKTGENGLEREENKYQGIIDRGGTIIINALYNYLDCFMHLIRCKIKYNFITKKEDQIKLNEAIDKEVIVCFIMSFVPVIIFMICNKINSIIYVISGYYVWRMVFIVVAKLRDISARFIESISRTIYIYILNVIEIILGFSFLYYVFDVSETMGDAIILSLRIVTTQGIDSNMISCATQKILIGSQLFVFIVMFIFIITNLSLLKIRKWKE